jgi:hypothetical protein
VQEEELYLVQSGRATFELDGERWSWATCGIPRGARTRITCGG